MKLDRFGCEPQEELVIRVFLFHKGSCDCREVSVVTSNVNLCRILFVTIFSKQRLQSLV